MSKSIFNIAAHSDPGRERDYQEDRYIICADLDVPEWSEAGRAQFSPGGRGTLLVVADGMGGLNAGEVASRLAIEGVMDYFSKQQTAGNTPQYILTRCISHANDRIIQHATKNKDTEGMGTTLVIAWIIGNTVYVGWSGDSRCYLVREDNIRQINWDHSYVQELVSSGQISAEDAFYHPNKNIITQSLGDVGRAPDPSTAEATLLPGDRLLLCSDGLNTMLHDPEIAQLLATGDPKRCAHDLVDAANAAGGYDNITVVVAEVVDVESAQLPVDYAPAEHIGVNTLKPGQAISVNSAPLKGDKNRQQWIMGLLAATSVLLLATILFIAKPFFSKSSNSDTPPLIAEDTSKSKSKTPEKSQNPSPPAVPDKTLNKTPFIKPNEPQIPEKLKQQAAQPPVKATDPYQEDLERRLKQVLNNTGDCKQTFDAIIYTATQYKNDKRLLDQAISTFREPIETNNCGDYSKVRTELGLINEIEKK